MSKSINYPTGESDKIPPLVLWGALFSRLAYDPPVIFTLGLQAVLDIINNSENHPVIIDHKLPTTEEEFLNEYLQPPKRKPPAQWKATAKFAQMINATLDDVEKNIYTELGVKSPGTQPGDTPPPSSLKVLKTGGFSGRRTGGRGKSGSSDFTCQELPLKHKSQLAKLKGWAVMYITTSTDLSVYLVAERASQAIYVIFRGSRSAQNAVSDANIFKIKKCPNSNQEFFGGVLHLDTEGLGTIINGLTFLADNFFAEGKGREIQVFSFGHSLGGGECTLFADIWDSTYKTLERPTQAKFKECIVCVSYGAPRIFNEAAMDAFMEKVTANPSKILYLRVWTGGDWVPTLPPEKLKYYHPKTAQIIPTLKFAPVWNTSLLAPGDKTKVNYNLSANGKFGAGTGGFSANAVAHMFQARINFWPVGFRAGTSAVHSTRMGLGKIVGGKMRIQVVLIGNSKDWAKPTDLPTVVKREFIRKEANLKAVAGFNDAKYDLETNLSENQQKRSENFAELLSNSSTEITPDACIEGLPPELSDTLVVANAEETKKIHQKTAQLQPSLEIDRRIINYVCGKRSEGGTKKHKKHKTKKRVKQVNKYKTKYRRSKKTRKYR